jgi:hypothetical protein
MIKMFKTILDIIIISGSSAVFILSIYDQFFTDKIVNWERTMLFYLLTALYFKNNIEVTAIIKPKKKK